MQHRETHRFGRMPARARVLLATTLLAGLAPRAEAFDFTLGNWQVNLDTTLSSSVDIRTSDIDYRFVGVENGGKFTLGNADNGTLNYRPGSPVAATQRITTELQVKQDDYGFFVRATGFYDPINDSYRGDFIPLNRAGVRDIGADLRLLDAYAFASPVILGQRVDFRVGNQALNWGESTFIPFGLNVITPIDLTALRTPGAELRTAFLPVPAIDAKADFGGGLSLEAFWQFYWTRDKLEPVGSFFATGSNADLLFDGGRYGLLFPNVPDAYSSVRALNFGSGNALGGAQPRLLDRHPDSLDEFGIALRKSFPEMGDAEFGLYYENYHSRTPFGSTRTGSQASVLPSALASLAGGYGPSYTSTAGFFADYPKDIHLIGASWNFTGPFGLAIQGEITHRLNQPIQIAASDQALLVNSPAACFLAAALGPVLGAAAVTACNDARRDPTIQLVGGVPGFDKITDGWRRYPVTQIQSTATKLINNVPSLDINSIALVGEIGFDYVHDFPTSRGVFNAPFTTDTNSAFVNSATSGGGNFHQALSKKGFATPFSGSSTFLAIIDMPNVLPYGIDMKPTVSMRYDFVGTSPIGVNVFLANTAAASVGVTFNYLQAWSLGVQYTNHFPVFAGGKYDNALDRDFASAVLTYEF